MSKLPPIKVLTVRQPLAYLIVRGPKDIENRSWRTHDDTMETLTLWTVNRR